MSNSPQSLEDILKKLYEMMTEVYYYRNELPNGKIERKMITFIEVSDNIWKMFMKDKFFKKLVENYSRVGYSIEVGGQNGEDYNYPNDTIPPNIGGYKVLKGNILDVHFQTYTKNSISKRRY